MFQSWIVLRMRGPPRGFTMAEEDDDAEYRRRLNEVLRASGFAWVVDQADAQIAEGKPSAKQISEREASRVEDDPSFAIRAPRRRRASLLTSEPYDEAERLGILLGAVEAALMLRADLEQAVLEEVPSIESITFVPDVPSDEIAPETLGKAHRLDRSRLGVGNEIQERARTVLSTLRSRRRAGT